jgi:peptidoglycan/LPS O-acetylase OafA/YrhL
MAASEKDPTGSAVSGLDTLRLFAALWVAMFHGARPPLSELVPVIGAALNALNLLTNFVFNGTAAVMVFFVISGFVIHRPAAEGRTLDLYGYLARRVLRIGPPILVAYGACALVGPESVEALSSVLWSLYCELAYYLIYPALFLAFRRGWTIHVFIVTSLVAFALLAVTGRTLYYWQLPLPTMIVVGLPNWILGCVLVERRIPAVPPTGLAGTIWQWRLGAVALSLALRLAAGRLEPPIGFPDTHWIAALYAFFWIERELAWRRLRPAPRWSETLGRGSYSLYLVHAPVLAVFGLADASARAFGPIGVMALWLAKVAAIGVTTFAFYRLCEWPSHRLARRVGAQLTQYGPKLSSRSVVVPPGVV